MQADGVVGVMRQARLNKAKHENPKKTFTMEQQHYLEVLKVLNAGQVLSQL